MLISRAFVVEDEEDEEEARKRRIAERIAKMGGVNPLAAPVRRASEISVKSADEGESAEGK